MTVEKLMEKAKCCYEQPKITQICNENDWNSIDSNNVESLLISHDYAGIIPDFSKFSKLKKLHISKNISLSEFEKMDLSSIEDLYVVFEKKEPIIQFNLSKLKKLEIYITNNDDDQLSLFNASEAIIDIKGCVALEELYLRHCTGFEIKCDTLYNLKKLVCCDYKYYNFEILNHTPNLVHLVATECRLNNIDFLDSTPNITYLDLTFNDIQEADKVLKLSNLQALHIYRNPLIDVEKYKSLPYRTFVTEKDREFLMFVHSISSSVVSAYSMLMAARKPDPKRKAYLQHIYDNQTDEQIFTRYLASGIKHNIEYHTSNEKNWRKNILLTPEELVEYVLQEYPFLSEFFEVKTEE